MNALGDTLAPLQGLQPKGPGLGPEGNAEARLLGAAGAIALLPWDDFDSPKLGPKSIDTKKIRLKQRIAKALSKEPGVEGLFCLAPIMTTLPRVPVDVLASSGAFQGTYVDFANQVLIDAYVAAVAELAAIPGFAERVRYFSIGNEVDFHLSGFIGIGAPWIAYTHFCKTVIPQVKSLLPGASIGVNWTFPGIRAFPALWKEMVADADALFINYYAVDLGKPGVAPPTYNVLTKAEYENDLAELLALPTTHGLDKPIVLQEVGMPTDSKLLGSEALQAEFVVSMLKHWDAAAMRVPFVSWFQLYDFLYDEKLKVAPQGGSIAVTQNTSPYPTTLSYYGLDTGLPFWGAGNDLAFVFRPFDVSELVPSNQTRVKYVNLSTSGGLEERLCRYLSTCGLVRQDGSRKTAWYDCQHELAQRRRQS